MRPIIAQEFFLQPDVSGGMVQVQGSMMERTNRSGGSRGNDSKIRVVIVVRAHPSAKNAGKVGQPLEGT